MRANRGDWEGAAEAFRMWTKGGNKILPGLVKRREAEILLFLSGT
jgi:lysozyme